MASSHVILVVLLVLSASVWTGGLVTMAVVARAARASLEPAGRVALFRRLGRSFLGVGASALLIALASGSILVNRRGWDGLALGAAAVAVAIVLALAFAVGQARRVSALRHELVANPHDTDLARTVAARGRAAGALRGLLGLLSIVLMVLGCMLAV